MKQKKNLLVFSNNSIYREVDIDEFEKDEILCGNTEKCDVRLKIKSNENIIIKFRKINEIWQIVENEYVYYVINGIKTPRKILIHGDMISIKHNVHKGELLKISYFIDLQSSTENYDLKIKLNRDKSNTIGCDESKDIFIKNEFLGNSNCTLNFENNIWVLYDNKTKYGVYVNGDIVKKKVIINNNDFIIITGYKFLFKEGYLYTSKYEKDIIVNGLNTTVKQEDNTLFKYPAFLRSPRKILNYPTDEVEILGPPQKPTKSNASLLMSLFPLIGSLGLTIAFRAGTSGDNRFIYYSIGSILIGGIVTVINLLKGKKEYNEAYTERIERYEEYIKEKTDLLQTLTKNQAENMFINYPTLKESFDIVIKYKRRLWERTPLNKDFLMVRLGSGSCQSTFKISVPKREFKPIDDPIAEKPYELYEQYKEINNVPVMMSLKDLGSIGVIGNQSNIEDFISSTTIDITAHHYSEEVKLVYIINELYYNNLNWIKWLPHTWSDDKKIRYISDRKESSHEIMKILYKMLQEREECIKSNKDAVFASHYVIYITDRKMIENEPIIQYIGREKYLGVTFIFLYEYIEYLPKECNAIITMKDNGVGNLQYTNKSEEIIDFKYEKLTYDQYDDYAKALSPVYIQDSFSEDSLKKSITLFELYNIKRAEQLKLDKNWSNNLIYKSMAAPLGVKHGDEVINLDLHEKYHGPHGLVAGTTGSGKSEILQSYVASMAINFHPHDVAFIVIDFKGGGMANQFRDLPHMIGAITNIDGNQIYRSLRSIDAELKKRQRVLAEYDVNHIDEYIKLYKSGLAKNPMPHLIIIVDEFAELRSEHPDFMAKLISTARIGRSLGVHLILATQKPAGVVDNQIWSNSKFKLCLKVQDKQDSNEVLKSPLAADIVDPGRAYIQVGNNEIFELFQSAWSGARAAEEDEVNKRDFEINRVMLDGRRIKVYSTKDNLSSEFNQTELENVISYINNYCKYNRIEKVQGLWLPPLESQIYLDELLEGYDNDEWMSIIIGKLDDPDNQIQQSLEINLGNSGHLMIIGSPSSGKTTLLQTIITALMKNYTPNEVNIYVLDFGSRILKTFEQAPHIGGVVTSDDEEKMKNFINFIMKEIKYRKDLFSSVGVTSLQSYRQFTGVNIPQIVICIDNYAAFVEYFDSYQDSINSISRDGVNVGVNLVVTANQSGAIRYKMAANFGQRIVLNCNDKLEYSSVIEGCKMQPTNVEGRGLISIDKRVLEFQVALPYKGENELEKSDSQRKYISRLNEIYHNMVAKQIPMMPKTLKLSDVFRNDNEFKKDTKKYAISLGISEEDIEYRHINLSEYPLISVVGKAKSGKTNFLNTIGETLSLNMEEAYSELYVIDSSNYGLTKLKDLDITASYIAEESKIENMLDEIYEELVCRYEQVNEMKLYMSKDFNINSVLEFKSHITVLIDDASSFTKTVSVNRELASKFNDMITKFSDLKISIIIGGTIDVFTAIPVNQVARTIKEETVGLVFEQMSNQRMFDFKTSYRNVEKPLCVGDAYFYDNGSYIKVKTPLVEHRN